MAVSYSGRTIKMTLEDVGLDMDGLKEKMKAAFELPDDAFDVLEILLFDADFKLDVVLTNVDDVQHLSRLTLKSEVIYRALWKTLLQLL